MIHTLQYIYVKHPRTELNYCEENPNTCQNGGKCTSLIKDDGSYRCECPSGYRGRMCQINLQQQMAANAQNATVTTPPANVPMLPSSDGAVAIVMAESAVVSATTSTTETAPVAIVTSETNGLDAMKDEVEPDDIDNEA